MKRGDIVLVAAQGDYGKPRPAVIVQSDTLAISDGSVIVCTMTTELRWAPTVRIQVPPDSTNGLRELSVIMVDKLVTVPRRKVRGPIGRLTALQLSELDSRLAAVLGLVVS